MNIIDKLIRQGLSNNVKSENDRIKQGLQRFKMDMMKHMPFYGDILMRVPVYEDEGIETAQTNGRCIRYNPKFFSKLGEGQRNYVLLHEVLHMLLFHWKRDREREPVIWNIACDYVVNGMLDRMTWKLNSFKIAFDRPFNGCFLDMPYTGTPVEEFYSRLMKENSDSNDSGKGKTKIKHNGRNVVMIPKDLFEALTSGEGDALTDSEAEICAQQIRELIRETVKRRGTGDSYYIPAQIFQLVSTKKLPWHKLLYEFLSERSEEESSYLTPERKYIHMDLIIPGIAKTEDELGEIWAFVDSSGSIEGNELAQFMTQLYRISKEFHCTFNIAFWDTSVTDVYRNVKNREEILKCRPNHSGGTDINCIYRYLHENNIKPGVMLVLTDGYYGRLTESIGKLRSRTILVLSENCADIDDKNEIGKPARL